MKRKSSGFRATQHPRRNLQQLVISRQRPDLPLELLLRAQIRIIPRPRPAIENNTRALPRNLQRQQHIIQNCLRRNGL